MEIASISFVVFAILVILASNVSHSPHTRNVVLGVASAYFVVSYVSGPLQLLPLASFLALSYLLIEWVRRSPSGGKLATALALVIASFIYLKRYTFLDGSLTLPFPYLMVGLSYILFRVLHMLIDARSGELPERVGALGYFNYTCSFLTFISGPIQRFQEFDAQSRNVVRLTEQGTFKAFARIVLGFVKVAVISAIANYVFSNLSGQLLSTEAALGLAARIAMYAVVLVAYTLYLYYNFSGYMDIVIGVAWLIGLDLPENFNKPFQARNFLEFWSRWHMTLSEWFKVYLFNPLLKVLAVRVEAAALQPYLGVIAFFVTFLVMGLWHGTTLVFLFYGLMLGAGASVNKLWQVAMTKRLGKKQYKTLGDNAVYASLCSGANFAYFALALTCFWVDTAQLRWLASSLGVVGVATSFAVVALGAAVFRFVADKAAVLATAPVVSRWQTLGSGVVVRNLGLAVQVMAIALVASFFHKSPEFVYRAF